MTPNAWIASSSAGPASSKASVTSPSSPRALDRGGECAKQARIALLAEHDAIAGFQPLGRRPGLPAMVQLLNSHRTCALPSRPPTPELSRNDPGVVEHQRVAGCEHREIADQLRRRLVRRHHQQPAASRGPGAARSARPAGDSRKGRADQQATISAPTSTRRRRDATDSGRSRSKGRTIRAR